MTRLEIFYHIKNLRFNYWQVEGLPAPKAHKKAIIDTVQTTWAIYLNSKG